MKIKPVEVKAWLRSLDVEDGTRYKCKTVMGTVFRFGQAEGLLPLGEAYNPISYVTGIPATSDYETVALTPEQALKVLDQLQQPEYTMIVLVAVTGIRGGEVLGLRWRDPVIRATPYGRLGALPGGGESGRKKRGIFFPTQWFRMRQEARMRIRT